MQDNHIRNHHYRRNLSLIYFPRVHMIYVLLFSSVQKGQLVLRCA